MVNDGHALPLWVDLTTAMVMMETARAIFFHGMQDERFGFLSNFYGCRFTDAHGNLFRSSEQYFMKQKQEAFEPQNERLARAIMTAATPSRAKALGRTVKNYDDDVWKTKRYAAMLQALKLKFASSDDLRARLLATGDKAIYEASHRDAIWGIGLGINKIAEMFRENRWFRESGQVPPPIQESYFGSNLLGKALMETREWLRSMQEQQELERV